VPTAAEAIEGGDAERGCEISVRATATVALAQGRFICFGSDLARGEEGCAHFAFERRAVEAAGDLQAGSPVKWMQGMQTAFHAAHVGNPHRHEDQEQRARFRNYVRARTAFDDCRR